MKIKRADVMAVVSQLETATASLKKLVQQLSDNPESAVQREAILALSEANRELLSYVVERGGRVRYEHVTRDLGLTTHMIGGRISVFTRNAPVDTGAILAYEGSPQAGWEIVLNPAYLDAARELELEPA